MTVANVFYALLPVARSKQHSAKGKNQIATGTGTNKINVYLRYPQMKEC